MKTYTVHLVKTSKFTAFKSLWSPPNPIDIRGMLNIECMRGMTLGAPLFSFQRILLQQLVVFIAWENSETIDDFLENHSFGKLLSEGWYVRLALVRQWGSCYPYQNLDTEQQSYSSQDPIVALTLARMSLFQLPRFLHWGRPAEKLVRDDQTAPLAIAAIRLPKTIATFSVWKSLDDMLNMVHGKNAVDAPKRHADAMKERRRKNFYDEFTTLRFVPISEHGTWNGKHFFSI